jgi:hypothetical protein
MADSTILIARIEHLERRIYELERELRKVKNDADAPKTLARDHVAQIFEQIDTGAPFEDSEKRFLGQLANEAGVEFLPDGTCTCESFHCLPMIMKKR